MLPRSPYDKCATNKTNVRNEKNKNYVSNKIELRYGPGGDSLRLSNLVRGGWVSITVMIIILSDHEKLLSPLEKSIMTLLPVGGRVMS